jgi:hypothetical protein
VAAALRRRIPLLLAAIAGYAGAQLAPASWHQITAPSYPLTHSAGVILVPLAQLRESGIDEGSSSRAPDIATDLETGLDELLVALDRGFLAGGYDAPPRSTQDVASLIAAYRQVFPTHRAEDWGQHLMSLRIESLAGVATRSHGANPGVEALLAAAAPPSDRLLLKAPPELRATLSERREALTALWSSLRGKEPAPDIELARGPDDPALRLDADEVRGRLRLYGDGRVVVTGAGLDAPESERQLAPPERLRLVLPLVAGGALAFDTFEAWRAAGAPGCPGLSTARPTSGADDIVVVSSGGHGRNTRLSVTLALKRLEEKRHGASMGPLERSAWFPGHLLDPRCQPDDPAIRELQSGLAALSSLVADIESTNRTAAANAAPPEPSAPPQPSAAPPPRDAPAEAVPVPAVREMPGLAIVFNGAGGQGVWITDGRRTGSITAERVGPGLFASGDGRYIAYRRWVHGDELMLFDRERRDPPLRLGPPEWSGYLAQWSPRSDALILGGGSPRIVGRIYLADAAGGALRQLASAQNGWPASWSADGRLVYLQRETTGGKGLGALDLAGKIVQVDHPAFESAKDFAPSPDGRHLAYRAYEVYGSLTPGLFTVPLDPATALPSPQVEPRQAATDYPSFAWAPDSRMLVYELRGAIHEVAPDGTGDRVLVAAPFGEYRNALPQVSPDGRWLLFLRQNGWEAGTGQDRGHIFVALRDGTDPVEIGYGERPLWIPGEIGRVEEAIPPGPSLPPVAID